MVCVAAGGGGGDVTGLRLAHPLCVQGQLQLLSLMTLTAGLLTLQALGRDLHTALVHTPHF